MASAGTSRPVTDRRTRQRAGRPGRAGCTRLERPRPGTDRRPGSRPAGVDAPSPWVRSTPPSVRRPQPTSLRTEHPVHDLRMGHEKASRAGEREATQRTGRDDIRDGSLPEDGDLAEEVAAREAGALAAIDHDRGLAVDDHVERAAGQPGAGPARPPRRPSPRRCGRCPRAGAMSGRRRARPRDRVDETVLVGHVRIVPRGRRARKANSRDPSRVRRVNRRATLP